MTNRKQPGGLLGRHPRQLIRTGSSLMKIVIMLLTKIILIGSSINSRQEFINKFCT